MERTTVYLADWQVLFREGIHFTLSGEEDIEVIGETTNNEEALSFIESNSPRVAILNANRNKPNGVEITCRVKQNLPSVSVILVMDEEDEEVLFSAIKSGASACLTKDIDPDDLLDVIREVTQGKRPISKELLRPGQALRVLDEFEAYSLISQQVDNLLARLTPREAELLRPIAEGSPLEQVASTLGISEDEVNHQLDLIISKLVANEHSRQLIEAMQHGLTSLSGRTQLLGKPEIEYITKDEFTTFKEGLKKSLESLFS